MNAKYFEANIGNKCNIIVAHAKSERSDGGLRYYDHDSIKFYGEITGVLDGFVILKTSDGTKVININFIVLVEL